LKTYFWTLCLVIAVSIPSSASAHTSVYTTTLSGPAEFPTNTSPGVGFSRLTVDLDLLTYRVEVNYSGLLGNPMAAHVHGPIPNPPADPIAGVATPLPSFPSFPSTKSGNYDQTFSLANASGYNTTFINANGGTISGAMNAFLNGLNTGKNYLNIHTSEFGGGEIRGFYKLVPEPSTASLLVMALGVLGTPRRRSPHGPTKA
jgi:hypothetical protein